MSVCNVLCDRYNSVLQNISREGRALTGHFCTCPFCRKTDRTHWGGCVASKRLPMHCDACFHEQPMGRAERQWVVNASAGVDMFDGLSSCCCHERNSCDTCHGYSIFRFRSSSCVRLWVSKFRVGLFLDLLTAVVSAYTPFPNSLQIIRRTDEVQRTSGWQGLCLTGRCV